MHYIDTKGRGDCLPRETKFGQEFTRFGDRIQAIPRTEWSDRLRAKASAKQYVRKIKNQRQEGSCASNATSTAYEVVTVKQLGPKKWVEMSAISLYKRVGRSAMSGSTIDGNLRELCERGLLPTTKYQGKVPHTMPETGFSKPFPSGWEATGKGFVGKEWLDIESFDQFFTALLLDLPVVYGRAGHAICGIDGSDERGYGVIYANSWGDWGDNGYGFDSESFISGAIRSYGAFALTSIETTPLLLGCTE